MSNERVYSLNVWGLSTPLSCFLNPKVVTPANTKDQCGIYISKLYAQQTLFNLSYAVICFVNFMSFRMIYMAQSRRYIQTKTSFLSFISFLFRARASPATPTLWPYFRPSQNDSRTWKITWSENRFSHASGVQLRDQHSFLRRDYSFLESRKISSPVVGGKTTTKENFDVVEEEYC